MGDIKAQNFDIETGDDIDGDDIEACGRGVGTTMVVPVLSRWGVRVEGYFGLWFFLCIFILRCLTTYYDVLRRTTTYYDILRATATYYDVI